MGQVLQGSAAPTETVRRALQRNQGSVRALARRHRLAIPRRDVSEADRGINPITVQKWRRRQTRADAAMGPKQAKSPVLTPGQEAVIVAFRLHTLLPLDDCLYALQPTIPALTRSAMHRCLQRHGISLEGSVQGVANQHARAGGYEQRHFAIDWERERAPARRARRR